MMELKKTDWFKSVISYCILGFPAQLLIPVFIIIVAPDVVGFLWDIMDESWKLKYTSMFGFAYAFTLINAGVMILNFRANKGKIILLKNKVYYFWLSFGNVLLVYTFLSLVFGRIY